MSLSGNTSGDPTNTTSDNGRNDQTRHIRLALLVNDTPVPPVVAAHGDYPVIYKHWLEQCKPSLSNGSKEDVAFTMDSFDVVNQPGVYPDPKEYHGIILTGSASSAYSPIPWIQQVTKYIADVATNHPKVRIIGICFGHQIIAGALGGECVPNSGLWEIGVTDVLLTPTGKDIFGSENMAIQQFHRDHVPTLPPGFILLGSTTICPIQGMLLPYPNPRLTDVPPTLANFDNPFPTITPADTHILTVQGHPEFTGPIVEKIVKVRKERGILDDKVATKAIEDGYKKHDGIGRIGDAVWKVLLSAV